MKLLIGLGIAVRKSVRDKTHNITVDQRGKTLKDVHCFVVGQMKFTSPYQGNNVAGLVGSSVSFTWSYSGGTSGVEEIAWGLKKDSADEFIAGGVLASRKTQTGNLVPVQVPADYTGRVNGSFSGDSSSGQATFTLTSIKKRDQRVYGCSLDSISNFEYPVFDFVNLVVQGGLLYQLHILYQLVDE